MLVAHILPPNTEYIIEHMFEISFFVEPICVRHRIVIVEALLTKKMVEILLIQAVIPIFHRDSIQIGNVCFDVRDIGRGAGWNPTVAIRSVCGHDLPKLLKIW